VKAKVNPIHALIIVLATIGIALFIMFKIADKPGDPLPGMAEAMSGGMAKGGGAGKKGGGRGGAPAKGKEGAPANKKGADAL
jgi:hypothetical protein